MFKKWTPLERRRIGSWMSVNTHDPSSYFTLSRGVWLPSWMSGLTRNQVPTKKFMLFCFGREARHSVHRASRWSPEWQIPATLGWRLQSHLRCRGILGECIAPVVFFVWSCDLLSVSLSLYLSFSFVSRPKSTQHSLDSLCS